MPCRPMTDPAAIGASSWPGAGSGRVVRSRTTSAGFATRRRRMTSPPRWPSGCHRARMRRPVDLSSCSFSRNSSRSPAGPRARPHPRIPPRAISCRPARSAIRLDPAWHPGGDELLDLPAGPDVEDRDPRATGIGVRGGDEPAVGRERESRDESSVRRSSVPIRSRARGGRGPPIVGRPQPPGRESQHHRDREVPPGARTG